MGWPPSGQGLIGPGKAVVGGTVEGHETGRLTKNKTMSWQEGKREVLTFSPRRKKGT